MNNVQTKMNKLSSFWSFFFFFCPLVFFFVHQDNRSALFFACEHCHKPVADFLVGQPGVDINAKDGPSGHTPLHRACIAGQTREGQQVSIGDSSELLKLPGLPVCVCLCLSHILLVQI